MMGAGEDPCQQHSPGKNDSAQKKKNKHPGALWLIADKCLAIEDLIGLRVARHVAGPGHVGAILLEHGHKEAQELFPGVPLVELHGQTMPACRGCHTNQGTRTHEYLSRRWKRVQRATMKRVQNSHNEKREEERVPPPLPPRTALTSIISSGGRGTANALSTTCRSGWSRCVNSSFNFPCGTGKQD